MLQQSCVENDSHDTAEFSVYTDLFPASSNNTLSKSEEFTNTRLYTLANREIHVCDICGVSLFSRNNLIRHRRKHTGERPFACTYCSKTFSRSDHLRRHTQIHEKNKALNCLQYKSAARRRDTSTSHQKSRKSAVMVCSDKNQTAVAAETNVCELAIDMKNETYDADEEILCKNNGHNESNCNSGCKLNLSSSVEDCNEYLEMNEKCLSANKRKVKLSSKNYTCEFCGATFVDSNSLSFHYKAYSNVDPFVCQYCGEWFLKLNNLLIHEQEHTGAKSDVRKEDVKSGLLSAEFQI